MRILRARRRRFPGYFGGVTWISLIGLFVLAALDSSAAVALALWTVALFLLLVALWWYGVLPLNARGESDHRDPRAEDAPPT